MSTRTGDWALRDRKRVGVIGGNNPGALVLALAERMGFLIAENGYILVNGGMSGVMAASAKGCHQAGGLVIGILPGMATKESNPYVDIAIPTGLRYMRNPLVVLNADVLVAIDGSYGTLSEIAYAHIYQRTVFGLNTWNIEGVISLPTPEEVMNQINQLFKSI